MPFLDLGDAYCIVDASFLAMSSDVALPININSNNKRPSVRARAPTGP